MKKNGQFSTELLVILGVVLLVTGAMIVLTQQSILNSEKTRQESQARNTLDTITSTANEVYAQGEGARKRIYVALPENYDAQESYVRNRTVKIRVGGGDFASNLDFDVRGTLPQAKGASYTWVTSEGNRVRIGDSMFLLSKYQVSMILKNNNTQNDSFTITNIHGSAINLTLATVWAHTDVSLTVTPTLQQNIEDNGTISINVSVLATENATGFYSGRIDINGSRGNVSEMVTVPVIVEVNYQLSIKAPPFSITPSIWNQSVMPNDTVSKVFQVCTNSLTSVGFVKFNTSLGAPGAWVGGLDNLSGQGADVCQQKIFNLTIPETAPANYSGYITADGGTAIAQDSVALAVEVGGEATDTRGPRVTSITKSPPRAFYLDLVTVTALIDDSTTGNSPIKSCQIQIDNKTWNSMSPSDGTFNSPVEYAYYVYSGINVSTHNASVRCTDSFDNVGDINSSTFRVMKAILFITRDGVNTQSEQDWRDWLNTHASGIGLKWQYDQYSRQDLSDGKIDKLNYATMLVAESAFNGALGTILVTEMASFSGSGGYIMLIDGGSANGLIALSLATLGTLNGGLNRVYINNSNHYITSPYGTNGTGVQYIYTPYSAEIWSVTRSGYTGTTLASINYPSFNEVALGDKLNISRVVSWGVTKPYRLNTIGNQITQRFFDYAINTSTLQ